MCICQSGERNASLFHAALRQLGCRRYVCCSVNRFALTLNRGFGLALAAIWVTGCVSYQPRELSAAKTAAGFDSRTLADPGLRAFLETNHVTSTWPREAWDLETLTLAAFYFHPDLDVARARWAVATAGRQTAGERPNPTLSVTPGYNTTTTIPSPWFVTPTLDIPIETAGKRGYRIAHASQLSEAARLNIASVAWQVRSRLRRSWVELYLARETLALERQKQATQEQVGRLLEAQLAAGAVSPFEVTQARVAVDQTRLALHDAEGRHQEAHAQLASAIGIPASALEELTLAFASLEQLPAGPPSSEARRQALLNRTDILGALAEYAASESALQLEIAKQYPDVHLSPGYEYDQGDNKWSLGLSVTLPILNQNQGAIAEAEARRAEAAAQFNALQARVLGEVDRATAAYQAAVAKAATAETLLASVQKQAQAARNRLDAGEISRLELSTVQMQLAETTLARLGARGQAQQAFGDLEEGLQSPTELLPSAKRSSSAP
jgi:outer membrane protein TolC